MQPRALSERLPGKRVRELAEKLCHIPLTQLISRKRIVNQAYDKVGLQRSQTLGPILDGIMRNTPEGRVTSCGSRPQKGQR